MPAATHWTSLVLVAVAAIACSGAPVGVEPDAVVDPGFIGPLSEAQTARWSVQPAGGGSSGGPGSSTLVGPGTLTLANGQVIVVDADTPGGTFCPGLGAPGETTNVDACVVVGLFKPGTNRAAWFTTEPAQIDLGHPDRFVAGQVDDIHGRSAIIRFSAGHYALPIRSDAVLTDCGDDGDLRADPIRLPRATAYVAHADLGNEVVEIVCNYN